MGPKTHHTALAILPPETIWEPIQAIRRQHDRQMRRWMPHLNLLYPFVPRTRWLTALPQVQAAAQQVTGFDITLAGFRAFTHATGSATLWLAPEPVDALRHLQATLQAALPVCDDLSKFPGGFTPHLSVGQVRASGDVQSLQQTLQSAWQPLRFTLQAVAVIWRQGDRPFEVAEWLPLAPAG